MRKNLKKLDGERKRFSATFERYGSKTAYKGPPLKTILLKIFVDIDTNSIVTDHLWFNFTKGFEALGELSPGTKIEFEARVKPYEAGYKGYNWEKSLDSPVRTDYKLAWPQRSKCVNKSAWDEEYFLSI